jgi:putative transposase
MHPMMICCRYRLYPPKQQSSLLLHNLDICRQLYNTLLSLKNPHIGRKQLQAMLPGMMKQHPELCDVYSKILQMVNNRLHYKLSVLHALKLSGKKVGRLRFRREGRYRTLNYNQSGYYNANIVGQDAFFWIHHDDQKFMRNT